MNLKYRAHWLFIGWCLIALIWYLSLTPSPPSIGIEVWDKLRHFMAYAGLMGWFGQLYKHNNDRFVWVAGFILMGIAIEFFQGMVTGRTFEYYDMLANTLGVLMAVAIIYLKGDGVLYWFEQRILKV